MNEENDKMMRIVILTPSKRLLDLSGVSEVYFPSENGVLGVLPGHAPMVTAVSTGVLHYTQNDASSFYKVAGGVAEITRNSVTLLVDVGEDAASIDLERAKRSLNRAEGRLADKEIGNVDVKRANSSRARALARIDAVNLNANKQSKDKKTV